MEDFLKHTKHCLLCLERFQEVHVVLGNEACDLDSMVSSLVYAFSFFKTLSSFPGNSVAVIPVFNMPQQDFGLRTEAVFLFGRCHIDPGLFTFNDDIELQTLLDTKRLKLVLVDHNVLSQAQRYMDIAVVEILDHHKDMWPSNLKVKKTIELVGSCSTLVAEKLLPLEILDSQMANLLLGTILLDTINLDPRAGRSTHKDQEIVKQLRDRYPVDLDELYTALSQAKFDVAGLSTRDLLRKDYKALPKHNNETPAVGISALSGLSMGMFFSRDRVQDDILMYCQTAALLDVLVIMFVHFPDGYKEPPQRQIAVCGPCEDLKTNIAQYLHASVELQLIEYCERHQDCFLYDQGNITATRKVVFPLVNDFLQSQL